MSIDENEISKDIIDEIVIKSASEIFFIQQETVTRKSRIDEDLCADGVSLLDLLDSIEHGLLQLSLSISLSKDVFKELDTIGELSDLIWNEVVAIVGEK